MKIGDVSRSFDIPMETLRYYESIGILQPARNDENGYREYTMQQWMQLAQLIKFRNIGLTLKEIRTFFEEGSVSYLSSCIDTRITAIKNRIDEETRILQWLTDYQKNVNMIPYNVGQFWYTSKPHCKCIEHLSRSGSEYRSVTDKKQLLEASQWRKKTPFVEACGMTSKEDILNNRNASQWVLLANAQDMDWLGLQHTCYVHDLPACCGLMTIIDKTDESGYTDALRPGLDHLEKQGFTLAGSIRSVCRLVIYQGSVKHRYQEIFYPIKPLSCHNP